MSNRKECITNCKSVANLELYQKIADHGNEKLGHMWDFTQDDITRVMYAITIYCIDKGTQSKKKELNDILYRELYWTEGDGAIKIITHCI